MAARTHLEPAVALQVADLNDWNASSEGIQHKVRHACNGELLDQRTTVRDLFRGSIGSQQECCWHAGRVQGVSGHWVIW